MTIHFPRRKPAMTGRVGLPAPLAPQNSPEPVLPPASGAPWSYRDEDLTAPLDRLRTEEMHRLPADDRPLGALIEVPQFQGRQAPRPGFTPSGPLPGAGAKPGPARRCPLPQSWPLPAPVPSFTPKAALRATAALRVPGTRAEEFAADKGSLPLFRSVVRERGFCGLHAPAPRGHVRWTTDNWAASVAAEIDRAVTLARMEIASMEAEFAEMERRRAAAADAAIFPVRHQ